VLKEQTENIITSVRRAGVIPCAGLVLLASVSLLDDRACAQANFHADYIISFARIAVGNVSLTADIGSAGYEMSATGRVGGAMRLLANGEAHLTARGTTAEARLTPTNFASKISSADDPLDVTMAIENGNVSELTASPPVNDGAALSDENRKGILDPLSALLIPADGIDDGLTACQRTLPIFDGRQRYDLQLAFKRFDKVTANTGYAGPVVVCSVRYHPIAGQWTSAPLVKYLAESREIEGAFAPVAGTRFLVPVRLLVTNLLANLLVQASRFEVAIQRQTPSNSSPNSPR